MTILKEYEKDSDTLYVLKYIHEAKEALQCIKIDNLDTSLDDECRRMVTGMVDELDTLISIILYRVEPI